MHYFLDGYNLLFTFIDSKQSLASQRQKLLNFLQKQFTSLHLKGTLVFDGAPRKEAEFSYQSPLEIVYAPKGQSADAYIIERLESEKHPHQMTVVTNDKGLIRHVRALHAKVQSNQVFIRFLKKRSLKRRKKTPVVETKYNIDRLLKIFEERLNELDF